MKLERVSYEYDGKMLIGELALEESYQGLRPGILIAHDAGGLGGHPREVARRLAALGYVAFALDYYGGGRQIDRSEFWARYRELTRDIEHIRGIIHAGLEVLLSCDCVDPERIAAIGYCYGGTMVLEAARGGADFRAVVGFHSNLVADKADDAANIRGKVLACIGAEDPLVPPEQRLAFEQEMRSAGADWQLNVYSGVVHSFTEPTADGRNPAMKYDRRAAERSWRAMLDLFSEVF